MARTGSAPWWRAHGWSVLVLLQPFLLLWWLVPGVGETSIGNDYPVYAIEYQQELLFSVVNGSYPLYAPGFHHGQSAAALSLGGLHHPIAWVCGLMPGSWHGHALSWNTLFRLLSLGLAQLALLRLLRGLSLPPWLAWLLSTASVYSLRMLDMFRFAATLEAWTGTWFLVAAAGWLWLDRRSRGAPLAVVLATWWLVCSGHPQFAYFGALAAGIFVLALPALGAAGLGTPSEPWPSAWAYLWRVASWGALGLGLSASLLLPFGLDFMASNSGRVGREWAWSLMYCDTPPGVLANFVLPLHADVHGAFGGSVLPLICLLLPLGRLAGLRLHRSAWIWLGLTVLVLLYTLGERGPVHRWAWELLPFFGAFRVPGRLSQLLPVLFLLQALLAWGAWRADARSAGRGLLLVLGLALAAHAAGPALWSAAPFRHTILNPQQLREVAWATELAVSGLGTASLVLLLLLVLRPRWRWAAGAIGALVLVQLGVCLQLGTWSEPRQPSATLEEMAGRKRTELEYFHGMHGEGLGMEQAVVREHDQRDMPFRRELARLCTAPRFAESREDAYALLEGRPAPAGACVIEGDGVSAEPGPARGRVELELATYNRQSFAVESPATGWLVVHHPFDGHWNATVDGRPVELLRADGLELAIPVPAGAAAVDLRYRSAAWTAGVSVSSGALMLLGLLAGAGLRGRRWRRLALAGAVVTPLLLLGLWRGSLYRGTHLGTEYLWQDGNAHIPPLRAELVRPPQLCRSTHGLEIPCRY